MVCIGLKNELAEIVVQRESKAINRDGQDNQVNCFVIQEIKALHPVHPVYPC